MSEETGTSLSSLFPCPPLTHPLILNSLYHEHISWDQATALRQAGLLPEYLPFPYPINGRAPAPGKRFEYKVPTAGVETSMKLMDESAVESNEMFGFEVREVDI